MSCLCGIEVSQPTLNSLFEIICYNIENMSVLNFFQLLPKFLIQGLIDEVLFERNIYSKQKVETFSSSLSPKCVITFES